MANPFVHHLDAPPESLDPAQCSTTRCLTVLWPIYETLFNLSSTHELVQGLAESWTVSPDGLTYTCQLRQNVRFHDGELFTAAAAKLSLERAAGPTSVRHSILGGLIERITTSHDDPSLDAHTMVVKLRSPNARLLVLAPMISPRALKQGEPALAKHPVGTGPFKFDSAHDDEIRLVRNNDYWGPEKALGDELVFRVVRDEREALRQFNNGELHFLRDVDPADVASVQAVGGEVIRVPALNIYYLGFNLRRPLFKNNLQLRQAVARAIDTNKIVKEYLPGVGTAARGLVPPGAKGQPRHIERLEHNPDAARELLEQAGAPTRPLRLLYNSSIRHVAEAAEAIRDDLARVGIPVELEGHEGYDALVRALDPKALSTDKGDGVMVLYSWAAILPDPAVFLAPLFTPASASNVTGYDNQKFTDLLTAAARTPNEAERRRLLHEAEQLVVNDVAVVPIYHKDRLAAVSGRVVRTPAFRLNLQSFPFDRWLGVTVS